jgi:hypothetical protein
MAERYTHFEDGGRIDGRLASPTPLRAPAAETARDTLIKEALRFSAWAAGEGLAPDDCEPARAPEDFLLDYSHQTGDENWDTLADRIAGKPEMCPKKSVPASTAWPVIKEWLARYAEEEATFSRYRDDVLLDGIMTAAEMRRLNAALAPATAAETAEREAERQYPDGGDDPRGRVVEVRRADQRAAFIAGASWQREQSAHVRDLAARLLSPPTEKE